MDSRIQAFRLALLTASLTIVSGCVSINTTPAQQFLTDVTYLKPDEAGLEMIRQKFGGYRQYAAAEPAARGLLTLCRRYHRNGHFSAAQSCLEDALDKPDQSYAEYKAAVAEIGALASAIALKPETDFLGDQQQSRAAVHFNLARLQLDLGNLEAARRHAEQGRQHLLKSQYRSATLVDFNLGTAQTAEGYGAGAIAHHALGHPDAAQELVGLCRQLKFKTRLGFPVETTGDDKRAFSACASAAFAIGDLDTAEALINQSVGGKAWRVIASIATFGVLELMGEAKQMTDPWDRTAIFLKGSICERRGNLACAASIYDALLGNAQRGIGMRSTDTALLEQRPNFYYRVLAQRAAVALAQHDEALAVELLRAAIDVIETLRSGIDTETARIGFAGDKQAVYATLVELLVRLGRHDEAFQFAERGKSRALVELLASRDSGDASVLQTLQRPEIEALDRAERERLLAGTNPDKAGQARGLRLKQLAELKTAHPKVAGLVTVEAPDLADLKQRLGPDETLLEYYGAGDNLFGFVVTREAIQARQLDAKELEGTIGQFRTALSNPDDPNANALARALYVRLIAPLARLKQGRLTLVPHGALHYLPFSALQSEHGPLIERHALRILPAASVLPYLNGPGAAGRELLALGNPDLGDSQLDLPGAEAEAKAIGQLYEQAEIVLREAASETRLKQQGGKYRRLHLASHGVFDPDQPLKSGLLLAQDDENDGTLTVGELYDLKLNADLVTLSACETGLGRVRSGDDVVGFSRGLLFAGASSIVATLWKVDDQATSALMQAFYKGLRTHDKAEALRLAQLETRRAYPHPYYWAAFQLTGAP